MANRPNSGISWPSAEERLKGFTASASPALVHTPTPHTHEGGRMGRRRKVELKGLEKPGGSLRQPSPHKDPPALGSRKGPSPMGHLDWGGM